MRVPSADVIAAAQAADRKWGIFASVSLAQWALESAWGEKATGKFNFFGVKATMLQSGVTCYTHEEVHGKLVPTSCRFRNYSSVADAFDEHARLIAIGKHPNGELIYAAAMAHKNDLQEFVKALGPVYATDAQYATKILTLIQDEGFSKYDTPEVT